MKTSCLISNYNYEKYLEDAILSAINQTVKFDEIIIVDDASTDSSPQIITQFAPEVNIKYILKEKNQGQLGCFNEAFNITTGDIIFFLDADDTYDNKYLEEALIFYQRHVECDFMFCAYEKFGASSGIFKVYDQDLDFGYSIIKTLCTGEWIGSITSTLSMRRNILSKILPIPYIEDWRVRADDCLVWGASLVGAKKFYLSKPLVKYRIHQNNNYHNSKSKVLDIDINHEYKRFCKRNSLFNYICQKNSIELPLLFTYTTLHELKTIPNPEYKDFSLYLKIIFLFEQNLYWKIKGIIQLFSYLFKMVIMGKIKLTLPT
ncbi:MAG: glycosyltransferase family 2 protein [Calothrix sp. C42_A2020_038]|nr:glycosyltransferase family 2 protein [Calothrix sp. C42_A2020_038]